MDTHDAWWKKSAEPGDGEPAAPQPQRTPEPSDGAAGDPDSGSIGDQVDHAIGQYEAKLQQLRDVLDDKRGEIRELEGEIVRVEKEQAKAFKELLGTNPQIRKMLTPNRSGKSRSSSRRKKKPAQD